METRIMLRRDTKDVLALEEWQDDHWTENDYIISCKAKDQAVLVQESKERVVGVIVYTYSNKVVRVKRMLGRIDLLLLRLVQGENRKVIVTVPLMEQKVLEHLTNLGFKVLKSLKDDMIVLTYREKSDVSS